MMLLRLAAAGVLFVAGASVATAEERGNPFPPIVCNDGSYMTGLEGRIGAWIDKVTIYCAKWNDTQLDVASSMRAQGFAGWSDGGNPSDASCPRGWLIAGPWSARYTRDDDILVLHSIAFNCRPPPGAVPADLVGVKFGSEFPITVREDAHDDLFNETSSECQDGEVAIGIEGRSGLYVDLLRILCGPAPKYDNPRVAGTKRKGGDNVIVGGELKRKGGDLIFAGGAAPPNEPLPPPPPPAPQVALVETTNDTDVYRKTPNGAFVRTDDNPAHFLPKGFVAPLLAKQGGWWLLELKNIVFAPGGEGWVAADQLKMK